MGELFKSMFAQLAHDLEHDRPDTALGRINKVLKTTAKIAIILVIGILFLPWILALVPMVGHLTEVRSEGASPLVRLYWLSSPIGLLALYCVWMIAQLPIAAVRYVLSGSADIQDGPIGHAPFAKYGALAVIMAVNVTACVMSAIAR